MSETHTELELREKLAEYAHSAWAGWMKYMFSKCYLAGDPDNLENADLIIPDEFVRRWTRQMNTPYTKLPNAEQVSDLDEADNILAIMEPVFAALRAERNDYRNTISLLVAASNQLVDDARQP